MQKGRTLMKESKQRHWQIADFHHVYTRGIVSPLDVVSNVIEALNATQQLRPPLHLLISRDDADIHSQAQASHER